jgi:hypothetical protein
MTRRATGVGGGWRNRTDLVGPVQIQRLPFDPAFARGRTRCGPVSERNTVLVIRSTRR